MPTSSTQVLDGLSADAVVVEEQEAVLPGDLRQARHDQDVGGEDAPAAEDQPVFGPNARVAQVNVVPQSGSALFSSL